MTKELGSPPEVLYATFDPVPFAAASTAQVHQARLHDGTLVAVKVQRPRILAKTQADLGVIQELAGRRRAALRGRPQGRPPGDRRASSPRASSRSSTTATRRTTPAGWPTGCSASRRSTSRWSGTSCPASASSPWSSSTASRSRRPTSSAPPASTPPSSGTVFIRAIIKQVLVDGFFHGDPHPGNILADPISKQIIFLDLGLVGQLNSQQRVDLLGLIYSIKEVDIPGIGDGLLALGKPTRQFDEARYRDDIDRLARQYLIYGKAIVARAMRSGRSWRPSSTTACGSTAS